MGIWIVKLYVTSNFPVIICTINYQWLICVLVIINWGNISIWFDPTTQWYTQLQGKQERNQTYSDTAIQYCLMIKSLFWLSLHIVIGFVQSIIRFCGWDCIAPNISAIRTPHSVENKSILIVRLAIKKSVINFIYS